MHVAISIRIGNVPATSNVDPALENGPQTGLDWNGPKTNKQTNKQKVHFFPRNLERARACVCARILPAGGRDPKRAGSRPPRN